MENKLNNIDYYRLSDKYSIVRADPKEFAVYESVYGDKICNRFAVKNWELRLAISTDNPFAKENSFYWITCGEVRVGGVLLEPNVLSRLFTIPPFTNMFGIIKLLKKLLLEWSDSSKNIYAYQIPQEQYEYFQMLGFWPDKSRRWMMRPTEAFNFIWDDTVIVKAPEQSCNIEIAKLFYESFSSNIDLNYDTKQYEDYLDEVNNYFRENTKDIFYEASSLIYGKVNGDLIGACLVSCCEEWPLIYSIAVNPLYRGRYLAKTMIKKALTILKREYPILRLFVTLGNDAESIYYELGFVLGAEFKRFYIPALNK